MRKLVRKGYRYLSLFAVLITVMGCGLGSVLAGERTPEVGWYAAGSTLLDVGMGTPSDATGAAATPSDAETGTPSDAEVGTPSDAELDEIVLLMDIPEDGCRTQEELVEQLLDESRERIVLASDIEWTEDIRIDVTGEKEVEMGTYRIRVGADSRFDVCGSVRFHGSGSQALFEVRGYFCPEYGVEIHASGEDAVAVDIIGGEWAARWVEIYASGRNAVAVRFTGSKEYTVVVCRIEAEGENSRGIEAEGDLRLFLSSVRGEESAASLERGELLLFGSDVSPEPGQVRIFPVLAVPNNRLVENGLCIAVGDPLTALWKKIENYREMTWIFFSEELEIDVMDGVPTDWSGLLNDTSVPGTYFAQCAPAEIPEWFPVKLYDLEIPIHVVDPDRPFIRDVEDAGNAARLRFFAPIRDAWEIRVEYSVDNRESWWDAAELPYSFVTETSASVEPLELNRDYWFRLVVEGGPMEGISNEILFVGDAIRKANGGGDRDHGDRGDQGEYAPQGEIIPPPDDDEAWVEKPGAEGSNTRKSDGTEPDIEEPDIEEPGIEEPDEMKSGVEEPDVAGANGSVVKEPDAVESDIADLHGEKLNGEPSTTDIMNHPSGIVTALPDHESDIQPEEISSALPQRSSRAIPVSLAWGVTVGIFAMGGGIYVCWKKYRKND